MDRCDLFEADPPDAAHRARIVEADLERVLIDRPGIVVCKVAAIARDLIPVALVELAGEGRRAERRHNRFSIISARLPRFTEITTTPQTLMRPARVSAPNPAPGNSKPRHHT